MADTTLESIPLSSPWQPTDFPFFSYSYSSVLVSSQTLYSCLISACRRGGSRRIRKLGTFGKLKVMFSATKRALMPFFVLLHFSPQPLSLLPSPNFVVAAPPWITSRPALAFCSLPSHDIARSPPFSLLNIKAPWWLFSHVSPSFSSVCVLVAYSMRFPTGSAKRRRRRRRWEMKREEREKKKKNSQPCSTTQAVCFFSIKSLQVSGNGRKRRAHTTLYEVIHYAF